MRLSAFIHDTLHEIALGVSLARARSLELVAVAPRTIDEQDVAEKTYVDFDVAVVVGEGRTSTKGGDAKVGADIQVASVVKVNLGGGGKVEHGAKSSTESTHRIAFKVPVDMNAHFRNNFGAITAARALLATHGIKAS